MSVSFGQGGDVRWGVGEDQPTPLRRLVRLALSLVALELRRRHRRATINGGLPHNVDAHFDDSDALTGGTRDAAAEHLASIRG